MSVSGWSAPSTRVRSLRSCWYWWMASGVCPAFPSQWARLWRVPSVFGVVGTHHPGVVVEELLVLVDGFMDLSRVSQRRCQVGADCQHVGVVGAKHPGVVVEELLELVDGFWGLSGLP